jgi:hypothetical protein
MAQFQGLAQRQDRLGENALDRCLHFAGIASPRQGCLYRLSLKFTLKRNCLGYVRYGISGCLTGEIK